MVLLAIVTTSNPYTVYFDHDIANPNYIHLISASIYNSWHNLKHRADMSYLDTELKKTTTRSFLPGHYTLDKINTPLGGMVIYNYDMAHVKLGHNLSELLGIGTNLMFMTFIKRLNSPTTYFIHCDLVNKDQNLVNGKPSNRLG